MNKLIGYTELNIGEGEPIEIKIGCYVLEKFCESYGIGLAEIGTVFEFRQIEVSEGVKQNVEVPREPIKFLSLILFHGANYAAKLQGKSEVSLVQAHEWIDEMGGFNSEGAIKVMTLFMGAIMNGGSPVKQDKPKSAKKKNQ